MAAIARVTQNFHLAPELVERLEKAARERGVPKVALVSELLGEGLDRIERAERKAAAK